MDDGFLSLLFSAGTKVLIAPVVILLVVVLGAFALVIGNTITHMNTHMHINQWESSREKSKQIAAKWFDCITDTVFITQTSHATTIFALIQN